MRTSVDVVVVSHNTRGATVRCVESVLRAATLAAVVVVDNGSTDGTPEAVAAAAPSAIVLCQSEPIGFAAAANRGAAAGSADLVLFLNSDAAAHFGAVDRLAEAMADHPTVAASTGRLVTPRNNKPQVGFAVRGFPTLASQAALLCGLERLWPTNPVSRRQLALDFDYESTHTTDAQPSGACLACQRGVFEAIGGFDEQFPFWFEDVDLVRRLASYGSVLYVHDAVFEHEGGLSVGRRPREELIASRYLGLVRYFDKHCGAGARLGIRLSVAASGTARSAAALAALRHREARAHLLGAVAAVRSRA